MLRNWVQYIMLFTLFTIIGNEVTTIVHGVLNASIVLVEDLQDEHDNKLVKKKAFEEKFFSDHLHARIRKITSITLALNVNQSSWYTQPVIEKIVPPPDLS
ncbi:hypothetical protein [Solitalea koreensis]|uniref:Uncharacterized protein n=1 Tax=Solitalea koreensis TaxID=543615 RepID=A0A521BAV4_9SPHI|nr:hypothetical protein [Solitalea koreensis]SMO44203.1 hypothetical protein SAMN06265350_10250 [Solitalea koreensis]